MEVTGIRVGDGEFVLTATQFDVAFEVEEKRKLPQHLDNFPTADNGLDGKARVLIIGYVVVSRQAYDPVYFEFSNEEQFFDISGPGVYSIVAETPMSYPSTITDKEFQVKYIARVSLKPWEENEFAEREFVVLRPVTRFDIALHHRKYLDVQSGDSEKKTKKGDVVGLTAHIEDPHPFGVGETVSVNYSIRASSSKPPVKTFTAKFIREVKIKVPKNAADDSNEFVKVLDEQKVAFQGADGDQLRFSVTSNVPSLEDCPTSVHWNIMHVHYFILLNVVLKDGQKIEVKLPLLCRGAIDVDDKVNADDEDAFPIEIPPSTYSPSVQRIAKIEHVDGQHVMLISQESEVFPLLRVFCRGEVLVRKPATVERSYTFIDHRTDFFNFEMSSGRNQLVTGFEEEAFDTFVAQHKMMPMSFDSPWIAIVYTCRIYGLKNTDFIESSFEWPAEQCPGFEAMLKEFSRVSEAPIKRQEVVADGSKKMICELNLRSRKAFIGSPISIDAVIEHSGNKKFSKIVAQLIQNVHYRIPDRHDMIYEDFSRIISEHVSNELIWDDVKLLLPEGIPPTVRCEWDILDISYIFVFKAETKAITKPLVQITVPILLGSRGSGTVNSANSLKDSHVRLQPVDDDGYDSQAEPSDQSREGTFLSNRTRDVNKSEIEAYTDDEEVIGVREPTFASERSPSRRPGKGTSHSLSPLGDVGVVSTPRRHRKKKHQHRSPKKSPRLSPMLQPSEASTSPRRKDGKKRGKNHHKSPRPSPSNSAATSPTRSPRLSPRSPMWMETPQWSSNRSPRRSPTRSTSHSPMRSRTHSLTTSRSPTRAPQKLPQKDTPPPITRVIKSRQRRRRGPSAQPQKINEVLVGGARPQWNHVNPGTRPILGGAKVRAANATLEKPLDDGSMPGWVQRLSQQRTLANSYKTNVKQVKDVNGK